MKPEPNNLNIKNKIHIISSLKVVFFIKKKIKNNFQNFQNFQYMNIININSFQ